MKKRVLAVLLSACMVAAVPYPVLAADTEAASTEEIGTEAAAEEPDSEEQAAEEEKDSKTDAEEQVESEEKTEDTAKESTVEERKAASTAIEGNFEYTEDDNGVTITKYTGSESEVVIPGQIDGKDVVAIGESAFAWCNKLTSVTIPDSITSIGESAFLYCRSLASITIPKSVTSIEGWAFFGCSSLVSVTIPFGVTSIERSVFESCSNLTSITIPDSVTSIGDLAFYGCKSLTSITIPDSVISIGSRVFGFCNKLTSITIPNGITSIEDYEFYECRSLTNIEIPNSVTSIGESAFESSSIKSITIPDRVTSIGDKAFYNCRLTSIEIPDSITSIGKSAFGECEGLTSITIPDGVTSIEDYTFYNCRSLTSIEIPNSVISIGKDAFGYCYSLTSITIPESITSIEENTFCDCHGLTSITIPSSVTSIGYGAFQSCIGLINIAIPDSITSIEENAFYRCSGLTSITIPADVTSIGYGAFASCIGLMNIAVDADNGKYTSKDGILYNKDLTELIQCPGGKSSITIPESVTSIGEQAFEGCEGLTSINIPVNVKNIGDVAFGYCSNLTDVYYPGTENQWDKIIIGEGNNRLTKAIIHYSSKTTSTEGEEGDFEYAVEDNGVTITKYTGSESDVVIPGQIDGKDVIAIGDEAFYQHKELISVTIPNSVTSIGNQAFYGCKKLTNISIPESVTSIAKGAFDGCIGLTSVTIPDSVTSIEEEVFRDCDHLTSITIPNSVTSIGKSAFYRCFNLASVTIPTSVTNIGGLAFYRCYTLTSITIPSSVTSIGYMAFYGCEGLTSITIPSSVTNIGQGGIANCSGLMNIVVDADNEKYTSEDGILYSKDLTELIQCPGGRSSITIPDNVTSIGDSAFEECEKLTSITIPDSVTTIGNSAFRYCISLTNITIPDSVTSIGESAFDGFNKLTDVYYTGSKEQWDKIMIDNNNDKLTNATIHYSSKVAVTDITVDKTELSLEEGQSETITANVTPDNASDKGIIWSSSDEKVATVDQNGKVTAVSAGTATITAAAKDGSKTSVSCTVTVKAVSTATEGNFEYTEDDNGVTITKYTGSESEVVIPGQIDGKDVIAIGDEAFSDCSSLTNITIPGSVTSIGFYSFTDCTALTSVEIPASVTTIDYGAFNNCSNLKDVYYGGTKDKWDEMLGGAIDPEDNEYLLEATIHYSSSKPDKKTFTDVTDSSSSYYAPVYWAAEKGITTGYSDGTFGIGKNCSRGAFVTFLWRQQGSPEPTLTAEKSGLKDFGSIGKSYQKAVLWAVEKGITTGYKDKTFRAGANVTRGAAVTFLYRAAGEPKVSITRNDVTFKDMVPAGSSYETGILWAVENKITTGYKKDNTFRPANNCTRGATVTFLKRFDELR